MSQLIAHTNADDDSLTVVEMDLLATELPHALERVQYTRARFEMLPLATPFVLPLVVHTLLAYFEVLYFNILHFWGIKLDTTNTTILCISNSTGVVNL